MNRRACILAAALLAALLDAVPAASAPTPVITLTGRGYGHGVGMSQYGAQGMALRGATHAEILAHYYPGTQLGPAEDTRIRILLASGTRVAIQAPVGTRLAGGPAVSGGLRAARAGAGVVLLGQGGAQLARGPRLRLVPGSRSIGVRGVRYRGEIELVPSFNGVMAIEHADLDDYIRGVVPREMPSTWEPAALEAQAIAARTYALATRKPGGEYDAYADVRSQVYGGIPAETPATDAAVQATAGLILTYEGEPIVTYFHSTSGGRTANVEDVLGGEPRPYLVSVVSPDDRISPHFRWPVRRFTRAALGRAVGLGRPVRTIRQKLTPSGRVAWVRFSNGRRSVTYTGTELRWKLGLRSSWFRFAIKQPAKPAKRTAAKAEQRPSPADQIARKLRRYGPPAGARPAPAPGKAPKGADGPARSLTDTPYVPDDPLLVPRQWHLGPEGISAFPLAVPGDLLAAAPVVRVAVIDGGVDPRAPDLAGLVPRELRRSFVPGRPLRASVHGTLVAGLIAARTGNGLGLAAPGVRVELMDLQVVSGESTIQPRHEAAAIRWAADHGARVINLSLGALRDPRPLSAGPRAADGFSPVEAAAVRYAVSRGALVVAAVGNGVNGRAWTFADWPAALPHVIGVGAVRRDRRPAAFSNRDPVHVDLVAPGTRLVSTAPVTAAASGLSVDAPGAGAGTIDERGEVQGTSFAAPQVSGAAALLLALRPDLTASQAAALLMQTARDVHRPGRDAATGPGELDVAAAVAQLLAGDVPPDDDLEPNDDGGDLARPLPRDVRVVRATADRWNDSLDVYRIVLRRGERLEARLRGPAAGDFDLLVSRPGGGSLSGLERGARERVVAGSFGDGTRERLAYRAPKAGAYELVVWAASGSGAYELALSRAP